MTTTRPPTIATRLIDYLKLEGVTHIFGIPGGGVAEVLNELYERPDEMEYVICRHETGGAYMADGMFRVTGNLGVVMVTTGPGATNALTGAVNAESACSRMLVLTGEVKEEFYGKGYLQEGMDGPLDVSDVFKNATAYSAVISSPKNAKTLIETALRVAGGTPHRTAHLSLPVDITQCEAEFDVPPSSALYTATPGVASDASVTQVLKALAAARRPLILVGDGCRIALRNTERLGQIQTMARSWGIPVMTTADGKGVYPETDPMSLGAFGIANSIWPYHWLSQTDPAFDALLVLGSGLGELATNKWNQLLEPDGPIMQIDANPSIIARDYETAMGIEGEVGGFIDSMARLEPPIRPDADLVTERRGVIARIKSEHSRFVSDEDYHSETAPMHPAALCRAMQEVLPNDNTVMMLDAGNCVGWGVHYLTAHLGFEVHPSLDMGPMGFGVAAVIGAKIALPDTVCVAFTGDGAFLMHGAEISTAQRIGCGAIWVVLQDNDLAMVSQGQHHFFGRDLERWQELYSLGSPDLVKFSEGLGAEAYLARSPEEARLHLATAVARAAKGIPQVLVAQIDCAAQPPYYNPLYGGGAPDGGQP